VKRPTQDVVWTVLDEIEEAGASFDAAAPDYDNRFLNLDRKAGEFLLFLIQVMRRRAIVEIGTSYGFSTIWLAMGLRKLLAGGRLITIGRNPQKQQEAIDNVTRAGLQEHVRFLLGDATDVVGKFDTPIDCVFFDADRVSAPLQLRTLLPKLSLDCVLIADNAISHGGELQAYFDLVAAQPDFQTLTLPIGKGLHVAYRSGNPGVLDCLGGLRT